MNPGISLLVSMTSTGISASLASLTAVWLTAGIWLVSLTADIYDCSGPLSDLWCLWLCSVFWVLDRILTTTKIVPLTSGLSDCAVFWTESLPPHRCSPPTPGRRSPASTSPPWRRSSAWRWFTRWRQWPCPTPSTTVVPALSPNLTCFFKTHTSTRRWAQVKPGTSSLRLPKIGRPNKLKHLVVTSMSLHESH